jgi:hypothetical protein
VRTRLSSAVLLAAWTGVASACSSDFDTSRDAGPRGTLGQEMFTVVCDRVAAQALPEDVSGTSWHAVCHADANGNYATTVDQSRLVALNPNAVDVDGNPVPLAVQQQERAYRVARIEALARDRVELTGAFDAAFPDVTIPLRDLGNPDPTQSCDAAGTGPLHHELAEVVGRLVTLEDDGTMPLFSEALARITNDVKAATDTQAALARFDARQGYRPLAIGLGAARPILADPQLVPMVRSLLSLLATDSDPYNPAGAIDPSKPLGIGNRKPIPGPAAPQMQQLLAVGREELRTEPTPALLPLLGTTNDPSVPGRVLLSRPRSTLEVTRQVMLQTDPTFDVGLTPTSYVVQRDPRAYAAVPLVNGAVPPPFVDMNGDGLPDVDDLGQFVTSNGQPAPSPFFTPDGVDGTRNSSGQVVGQATPTLYQYLDVGQTFTATLESDILPLTDPDPTHGHEALMNVLGGSYVLFGQRDSGPTSVASFAPDPASAQPTQPVTVPYSAFHPDTSPLVDLVYALGVLMADPVTDDTLQLARQLMAQHPQALARLVGIGLQIKTIANAHPEAHIPASSTLWDELLDDIAAIAHVQDNIGAGGVLEDLMLSFADDRTPNLQTAFAAYTGHCDSLTYDHGSTDCSTYTDTTRCLLNGPPYDLTTQSVGMPQTACNRGQPDVASNRSELQMFMQTLHDARGMDACTKQGAVAHVKFSLGVLGTLSFDYPTDSLSGVACTLVGAPAPPNPMPKCGLLRIQNVDGLLLDVVLGRAKFDIRDPCLLALMNSPLTNIVGGADAFLQTQSGIVGFDTAPTVPGVSRLFFFETPDDGSTGDMNPATLQTYNFVQGLIDPAQTMACAAAPFTDSDGTVVNLRDCTATPQYDLRHRDPGATFPLELYGFAANVQPLAASFDNHQQSALFVDLFNTLHLHWGSTQQTSDICDPTLPKTDDRWCSQDGAVSYEPLLYDVLTSTDLLQSLHDTLPIVEQTMVTHCDKQDPTTHLCTQTSPRNGIQVLAQAVRDMVDPALNQGLTDRHGVQTAPRNDGTTNPQVTPIYLVIDALDGIDAAFASWAQSHPNDDRQPAWRAARSQIVDEFFGVTGTGTQATWTNQAIPAIVPPLLDAVAQQVLAECPDRSSRAACTWWPQSMPQNLSDVVGGPTFAGVMDLLDAIRADDTSRTQLEQLLQYLLGTASPSDARAATMTATVDLLQILNDDTNLAPFYHSVADALSAQTLDAQGNVTQRGLADASIEALSRIFAAGYDGQGHELCSEEIDPNQAIAATLQSMVTPMGNNDLTPIEVIIDVVADVNRANPAVTTKLDGGDYGNMANEISEFCLDPASGLEQVYEVVREATLPGQGP